MSELQMRTKKYDFFSCYNTQVHDGAIILYL